MSGTWTAVIQGTSVPTGGTPVAAFVSVNSSITLAGQVDRVWYAPGATAVITTTLSGSVASANVAAQISRSDGTTQSVSFSPVGAGQYRGTFIIRMYPVMPEPI